MHDGLGPFEGRGCLVVGHDKFVDCFADLPGRSETHAAESLLLKDTEPDFDLIHPGGVGWREVKFHQGVLLQPAVIFWLVGVQVVQNNVDLLAWVVGDKAIHIIEEFPAPAARIVPCLDLSSGNVQRGEKRGCAVPLVAVTVPIHALTVRQPQPSLSALKGLNGRLLVHAHHQRVYRRFQIQAHDVRRFGTEFGVCTDTPTPPSLQANVILAQNPPDHVIADIS
jgi:hypothetical protein